MVVSNRFHVKNTIVIYFLQLNLGDERCLKKGLKLANFQL